MRETAINNYFELVLRTYYFELREGFDSFEERFILNIIFEQFVEKLVKSNAKQVHVTDFVSTTEKYLN